MAQTKLEKIGTIYSRVRGLLKSGSISLDKKPLWYEIYETFPPKYEPRWDRIIDNGKRTHNRKILYSEDDIRAKYYQQFGELIKEKHDLFDNETKSLSQIFIEKWREIEKSGEISSDAAADDKTMFKATVDALEVEGLHLLKLADPHSGGSDFNHQKMKIKNESSNTNQKNHKLSQNIEAPSLLEIFEKATENSKDPTHNK